MSNLETLEDLARLLKARDSFVICGHSSPDGDCLGSEFALAAALRSMGKEAVCLLAKDAPLSIPLHNMAQQGGAVFAKDYAGPVDTFVSVDVPTAERMGEAASALHAAAACSITIDHHISHAPMSQHNYIDPDAPACALIVWRLLGCLGVQVDAYMASCCYAGLMTDTGRFQYQNTTPEAFAAASEMARAGANPAELACLFYQNRTAASFELEKRMLSHCELMGDGQIVFSHLSAHDMEQAQGTGADAEDLIDTLRSLAGTRIAALLREQDGIVRGSLRAKDDTDVATLAQHFGGGGHRAAAGFTSKKSLEEVLGELRLLFEDSLRA